MKKIDNLEAKIQKKAKEDFKELLDKLIRSNISEGISTRIRNISDLDEYDKKRLGYLSGIINKIGGTDEDDEDGQDNIEHLLDPINEEIERVIEKTYRELEKDINNFAERNFLKQLEDHQIHKLKE